MKNWISQFVISNNLKMGLRTPPFAFTEHGIAMLSSVLKSETAIAVNIQIIRVFSKMRELLISDQAFLSKLKELEKQNIQQDYKIKSIFDFIKNFNKVQKAKQERGKIGY